MLIFASLDKIFWEKFIKIFVKVYSFQKNIVYTLNINIKSPIIYLLPDHSKIDLFTLQKKCLHIGLPDPLEPLKIFENVFLRYIFLQGFVKTRSTSTLDLKLLTLLNSILILHRHYSELDIQILPVSIIFRRALIREEKGVSQTKRHTYLSGIYKFFSVFFFGRDSLVCFSKAVSMRYILNKYGYDKNITKKLIRVARIYFIRQRLIVTGPLLPLRHDLLRKLLCSNSISQAIEEEVKRKKISYIKAQTHALIFIKEIISNFSELAIYIANHLMRRAFSIFYQDINVSGIQRIFQLYQNGNIIVYLPCHRSHMDYLLLSYVLYRHGLSLPHIAAGINLNTWPLGVIFRYLGAFFIRREFKFNKLYATVFREYLWELFNKGYSIEYFIEGGRSRSGYLRSPKTGMILMTLQSMLRTGNRHIILVPIYMGYEHIIEVGAYKNELYGRTNKKEGCISMIHGLRKLRNFGKSYVNFGEPLSLVKYLNQHEPEWWKCIDKTSFQHPVWLTAVTHNLAEEIMTRINSAVVVNAINLCSTILLVSQKCSLTFQQLTEQIECYLQLLRNVPYSCDIVIPETNAQDLIKHALHIGKIKFKRNEMSSIIIIPKEEIGLLSYYRNNICHLLVIPSLIAAIVIKYKTLSRIELFHQVTVIYPMLKSELFLCWDLNELPNLLNASLFELKRQGLLQEEDFLISAKRCSFHKLQLLASNIR
ncbi:glycerol-3-phosphate 1-O-acyltransferase PlsB [Candidatus Erwinia haradaeae]|uniref:glycerol-3-phosphate 1-O-acyltransferase PlsB n=1 Tax=Candidatus Erwinia haradaeae TaxID=1922217 RepID=UPI001300A892|nr:glycerol-3-phosphate 1-O-acyltransferase PlsB [Candidatus Erwinia haradaeae]